MVGIPASMPLPWIIGRYALHAPIASGGMATVHLGRLVGPAGFARTVAIKRLHPQYAKDPPFVAMFLDEARLAARIQHPNVVSTVDVVATEGELFVVMEYIRGEALSRLVRVAKADGSPIPLPIVSAVLVGALHGLHAAHETKDERGQPLGIVHRDVSPQNILVGADGVPRVLDFGVAKAAGRVQTTHEGQLKGKLAYMAPEQMRQATLDRTADLYAAAVVLWETLTLKRLFKGDNEAQVLAKVLDGRVPPPSEIRGDVPAELDAFVLRALSRDREKRFRSGHEMALALERIVRPATSTEVGTWVQAIAAEPLQRRSEQIAEIESLSGVESGVATQAKQFMESFATGSHAAVTGDEISRPAKSQASSLSVSSSTKEAPKPPPRRTLAIFLGGVVVALVVVALVRVSLFSPTTASAGATAATATPPPSSSSEAAMPKPDPTPLPSASSIASPLASSAPPASPAPSPVTPPRPTPGRGRSAPAPRSSPAPPPATAHEPQSAPSPPSPPPAPAIKKECDPPYTIDSSGQKHYKSECF